jgi:hypothetical protein
MRDTTRAPEAATSTEYLEAVALAAIRTNIEAHAQSLGRTLPGADLDTMLKAAQSYLRRLPREQLAGFRSSSSLMSAITKDSFAAASVTDAKAAALVAAQTQAGGSDPANVIAGRFRDSFERATLTSSQRYAAMSGETFSQADTAKIAAAMGVARDHGMTWMTPRDLLSIGAAGVKAMAAVQLTQQSYDRLRTDGRFDARDVVTLADYAKSKGITNANQAAGAVADFVRLGQDQAEQQRLKSAVVDFMKASNDAGVAPQDPAAQQRLQQAGTKYRQTATAIANRSPEAAATTRRMGDANKIPELYRAAAKQKAESVLKEVQADALYAAAAQPVPAIASPPNKADAGPVMPNAKDPVKTVDVAATVPKITAPKL